MRRAVAPFRLGRGLAMSYSRGAALAPPAARRPEGRCWGLLVWRRPGRGLCSRCRRCCLGHCLGPALPVRLDVPFRPLVPRVIVGTVWRWFPWGLSTNSRSLAPVGQEDGVGDAQDHPGAHGLSRARCSPSPLHGHGEGVEAAVGLEIAVSGQKGLLVTQGSVAPRGHSGRSQGVRRAGASPGAGSHPANRLRAC